MCSLLFAYLLAKPTPEEALRVALAGLCEDVVGYQRLLRAPKAGRKEFQAWIEHAGIAGANLDDDGADARDGGVTPEFQPGLFLTWGMPNPVTRVTGLKDGLLVSMAYVDRMDPISLSAHVTVLIRNMGGQPRYNVVDSHHECYEVMNFGSAAWSKQRLYVSGVFPWYKETSTYDLVSYFNEGGTWQKSKVTTGVRPDQESRLELDQKGEVKPVRLSGPARWENLDVPQADTELDDVEVWKFVNGRPVLVWRSPDDTPIATLDRIYPKMTWGYPSEIGVHCSKRELADKIVSLYANRCGEKPTLVFPDGQHQLDSRVLGLKNFRAWFHFQRLKGDWMIVKITPMPDQG